MTLENTKNKVFYEPNGVQTEFIYDFPIVSAVHMQVYTDGVLITTGYTVTGAGESDGGSVVFDTAPQSTISVLNLIRQMPLTQLTAYPPFNPFPSQSHEQTLDGMTMLIQQNGEAIDRSLKTPLGDPNVDMTLPNIATRGSKVLGFDTTGGYAVSQSTLTAMDSVVQAGLSQGIAISTDYFTGDGVTTEFSLSVTPPNTSALLVTVDSVVLDPDEYTLSSATLTLSPAPADESEITARNLGYQLPIIQAGVANVDTIADLRNVITPSAEVSSIQALGYYTKGDGGGGLARTFDGGRAPGYHVDNGGTVIVPTGGDGSTAWVMSYLGDLDAGWFGFLPDGISRDANLQSVLAVGENVHISAGDYIYTTTIVPLYGQRIYGNGYDSTNLDFRGTGRGFEAVVQGLNRWELSNLSIAGDESIAPTEMIYLKGPDDFLIENVWGSDWYPGDGLVIEGDAGFGVYYSNVRNFKINGVKDTYSCNRGLVVDSTLNTANSLIFDNPKIYRCFSDAVYLHACRALTFIHPNIERNGGYGFNFDSDKSGDSTFIYGVGIFGGYFEHNNQDGVETLFHSNSANTIGVYASGFRNIDVLKDGVWTGRGNALYSDGLEGQQVSTLDSVTDDDLGLSYQTAGKVSLKDVSKGLTSFIDYLKSSGQLIVGNGNEVNIRGSETYGTYTTLSDDATPSVLGAKWCRLSHSAATTITDFDDPLPGQVIILYASNNNTTVQHGTNIYLKGDADVPMGTRDTMHLIYNGSSGEWLEI